MKKSILIIFTALCMLILTSCSSKYSENSTTSLSAATSKQVNPPVSDNSSAASSFQATVPTTTAHTHSFSDPDCNNPQKCATCGLIGGAALGHQWMDATCQSSKKCSRCGETTGEKIAHDSIEGKCSMCGLDYFDELASLIKNSPLVTYHPKSEWSDQNYQILYELNQKNYNTFLLSDNKNVFIVYYPDSNEIKLTMNVRDAYGDALYLSHIYMSKTNIKKQNYQWDHLMSGSHLYEMSGTLNAHGFSPNTQALSFDNSTFISKNTEGENAQIAAYNVKFMLQEGLQQLLSTSTHDISLVHYGFEYFE